jgi:hypothetical protein
MVSPSRESTSPGPLQEDSDDDDDDDDDSSSEASVEP